MQKLTAKTLTGERITLIMDEVGETIWPDTVMIRGIACELSSLRVANECEGCNEPEPPRGKGPEMGGGISFGCERISFGEGG